MSNFDTGLSALVQPPPLKLDAKKNTGPFHPGPTPPPTPRTEQPGRAHKSTPCGVVVLVVVGSGGGGAGGRIGNHPKTNVVRGSGPTVVKFTSSRGIRVRIWMV